MLKNTNQFQIIEYKELKIVQQLQLCTIKVKKNIDLEKMSQDFDVNH